MRLRYITFGALLVAGLLLIGASQLGPVTTAQGYVATPLNALQAWFSQQTGGIGRFFETLRNLGQLQDRVTQLEKENAAYETEIVQLREVKARYDQVSALLGYARNNPQFEELPANVIGYDPSNFLRYLEIDKGTEAGLKVGLSVVTERGLVGRISSVGPRSARIMLLTDRTSIVNARLQNSRADGTVEGQLTPIMRMRFIPQEETITEGEVVLTSGVGGQFPPGLVIGQVAKIQQEDRQLFQEADVRPAVDFERLEIVLVITNFEPIQLNDPTRP